MKFWLLTHERELNRKTNTGVCALKVEGIDIARVLWQRKEPSGELLEIIHTGRAALLYPGEDSCELTPAVITNFNHLIVLDATWQEAQKMMNQSPYLHALKRVSVINDRKSTYTLRRNQRESGLCTAECISECLNVSNRSDLAQRVDANLTALQAR